MIQKNYEQLVRELEKEMVLLKEKYRILEETTQAILFEYLPENDRMIFFYNLPENKDRIEVSDYLAMVKPLVHSDHIVEFIRVLQEACSQPIKGELEYLSLISGNKDYQWHKAYYSSIADENGMVISVMGRIQNTHDSAVHIKDIINKVETDLLTGFYKKEAAKEKITKWLLHNPTNDAYMIMIDFFNFREINDHYGHIYGDEVLQEITGIINACFSCGCITARWGGAEFLIFAKAKDLRTVESQVDEFLHRLSKHTTSISSPPACNIGIAGRIERDDGFEDIFNRTENAVYFSKQAGVNKYYVSK